MKKRTIGILGGMGPEASVYLYRLLIEKAAKEFGAKNNDDFPEIILHSIPVPDFISDSVAKEEALQMLKKRVKFLRYTNLAYLGIACNTAHVLLPQLAQETSTPFISMIEAVVNKVIQANFKIVGVMGTPSTITSRLYQQSLADNAISSIVPNKKEMLLLEKIIRDVIRNKLNKTNRTGLLRIADSLQKRGAKAIILGCTELPLVFPKQYNCPVFNSVDILAEALLQKYYE